jgi:hypothetical protein
MPDGQEEREELKSRIEEELRRGREDPPDPDEIDEWEPERVDS